MHVISCWICVISFWICEQMEFLGWLKISFSGFDSHVCQIVLNPFKFRYALQFESNILIPTVFSKYLLNN